MVVGVDDEVGVVVILCVEIDGEDLVCFGIGIFRSCVFESEEGSFCYIVEGV